MTQSSECCEKPIEAPVVPAPVARPKRKRVQEKVMFFLTLFFIGGVVLYSILPAGPVRSTAIGAFSLLMTYMLYRFGI